MSTEKYIGLELQAQGDPSKGIMLKELNALDIDPHQVLVELIASPINISDLFKIQPQPLDGFDFPKPKLPSFLGGEGVKLR